MSFETNYYLKNNDVNSKCLMSLFLSFITSTFFFNRYPSNYECRSLSVGAIPCGLALPVFSTILTRSPVRSPLSTLPIVYVRHIWTAHFSYLLGITWPCRSVTFFFRFRVSESISERDTKLRPFGNSPGDL